MFLRQRYHNATGTGELTGPSGAEPKARVTYTAMYYDEIGRPLATANYGTNGGVAPTRPATVPARSDDVLVRSIEYDDAGMASRTIDPAGREHRQFFDALGRSVKTVENYVDGLVDGNYPDEDVTVERTYTPDGLLSTLTAKNPATGDQVTRYVYGTTLADSGVARADLLRAEIYPDSDDTPDPLAHGPDGVYDRVEYRYNRQGEVVQKKDQNGTVHAYEYDRLGRKIHDQVTTVGSGVDPAVRRISTTYEIRGMVEKVTSYDSPTVGAGSVVNEVAFAYDDTGRLVREYQEHAGAKDAATLSVGYTYDPSADAGQFTKGLRPTSLRYPNGRLAHFTYGPPEGTNDALGRLAAIHDDDAGSPGQRLAEYTYLGLGTIVVEDYPQPQVKLDYTGEGSYRGFDRFGRIVDHRWIAYGQTPEAVLDRYTYQYDRAGNRTRRTNELNHAFDETYGYDRINRLVSAARADGFAQSWTLDALGNFRQFDDNGNLQTRTANPVNEITAITGGWITPAYDAAGNLTSGPKPRQETTRIHYRYDAWNRLVKVYADDSQNPGEPGDLVAEYVYDGANRRVEKLVTQAGGDPRQVHYYYNHNWQLLEERFLDGQGVTIASNQYVWSARYIDAPIVRIHDGNGDGDYLDAEDNVRYYTGDANYNVTAAIDATTGEVVSRFVYPPYGTATLYDADWSNAAAPATDSPLYCGYFFDAETALYHVRNRYYDSSLSTFISRDPIESAPNLYAYVGANTLTRTDPHGLSYEENCISACIAGCDEEFSWHNPQRYICRSYCDNTCTDTPDLLDRWYRQCGAARAAFNNSAVNCTCSVLQVLDIAPGIGQHPAIVTADAICSGLGAFVAACDAADSGSAFDYFRAGMLISMGIGDVVGEFLGPGSTVSDAILSGIQNMLANESWNPAAPQLKCLCDFGNSYRDMLRDFARKMVEFDDLLGRWAEDQVRRQF